MHVVVQRRREPPPPPRRKPGSWFELDTAMARDVAHDLVSHPDEENRRMRGHHQQEHWQERRLQERFAD